MDRDEPTFDTSDNRRGKLEGQSQEEISHEVSEQFAMWEELGDRQEARKIAAENQRPFSQSPQMKLQRSLQTLWR